MFDFATVMKALPEGMLLEFGVAAGASINVFAGLCAPRVIYGFDWFKGLPADWVMRDGVMPVRGAFRTDRPVVLPNVSLVEGMFSDTLEPFLEQNQGDIAFCHIDCDLYNSSMYVLNCVADRFVIGSVLVFDEIEGEGCWGELRAWEKYQGQNKTQHWEFIGHQHYQGRVYRLGI